MVHNVAWAAPHTHTHRHTHTETMSKLLHLTRHRRGVLQNMNYKTVCFRRNTGHNLSSWQSLQSWWYSIHMGYACTYLVSGKMNTEHYYTSLNKSFTFYLQSRMYVTLTRLSHKWGFVMLIMTVRTELMNQLFVVSQMYTHIQSLHITGLTWVSAFPRSFQDPHGINLCKNSLY